MIKKYFALSLITASIVVAGCSSDDNTTETPAPTDPTSTPGVGGTAYDTIVNSDDHSTLEAAINAAGLADALDNPANAFTIFAPTNAAFEALDNDGDDATLTSTQLLEAGNQAALIRTLQYHVVSGDVSSTAVSQLITDAGDGAATANTLLTDNGTAQTIAFTTSDTAGAGVAVNGVDVATADVVADESPVGRVHVIGAVLAAPAAPTDGGTDGTTDGGDGGTDGGDGGTDGGDGGTTTPPSGAVDTALANAGVYEIFRAAVNRDFGGTLDSNAWTVFVPNDTTLGAAGLSDLTVPQQQAHIVSNGANDAATLAGLTSILSSSNISYPVTTANGVTSVNGFPVELITTGAGGAQIYSIGGVLTAP